MTKTIVGLYDDFASAERTVQDLVNSGFARDDMSMVASNATGEYDRYATDTGTTSAERRTQVDADDITAGEGAGIGAGIGATIGGVGGLLMGLGLLAIPGVGPALAAGPIVSALVGAGIGAVAGGLTGALVNLGVPEEEAGYYAEGVRRGGTLVTVAAADHMADQAVNIMNRYDPIDIHERAEHWRQKGWTGHDPRAKPYTPDQIYTEREYFRNLDTQGGKAAIPVMDEELQVGKRTVSQGGIRVRSYVTEQPVEQQVRLRDEQVDVERRPVNRPANADDINAFQEGTIEMTETTEEPVVTKRARVIEEIVIRKDVGERTETISDTVRRSNVDVEHTDSERAVGTQAHGFDTFEKDFHTHYTRSAANTGYTYDQYAPVYRYGYNLGTNERYRNSDWATVEPEARRHWEERNPGTWEEFKDSVRYAWDRVRGRR